MKRSMKKLQSQEGKGKKGSVETVEDGWNVLVGANDGAIIKMANDFEPEGEQRDVFGSGDASERIREIIGRGEHEKN